MKKELAACRICGRTDDISNGVLDPEPEFGADITARMTYEGEMKGLDPILHGWRWTCGTCLEDRRNGTQYASALRALIGVEEPENVARRVLDALVKVDWNTGEYSGHVAARDCGRVGKKPWGHVDQRALDDLNAIYAHEMMRDLPKACKDGACYWCGVRTAQDWFDSPFRWQDGTRAPLCPACFAVFDKRGRPTANDPDAVIFGQSMHVAASEAATGYNVGLGRGVGGEFRVYGETRECDKTGHDERWRYGPKIIEYREETWTRHPECAPADRRGEFEQKKSDRLMKARAERLAESRAALARGW